MTPTVLSVAEVNNRIKSVLEKNPELGKLIVRGELSNYKIYTSGHHYFTLKDSESALRCVMFRNAAQTLRFRPADGMSVLCYGRISTYPRDGAYQLYTTRIDQDGVGNIYAAFEELKAKLGAEGLFDESRKKPLPRFPRRIAVITSGDGAALHDICMILKARYPLAKVLVMPVRVQGVEAPAEIVSALRYANAHKIADVIIEGRGGGAYEDLIAFNDERVARAIAASEIPVISAVGHEPDVTISDYAADVRAATPSNAAEICVPDSAALRAYLQSSLNRLETNITNLTSNRRRQLTNLSQSRVLASPMGYVEERRQTHDMLSARFRTAYERYLETRRSRLGNFAASVDALSPLKVLARGYALPLKNGSALKSVREVTAGDALTLRLNDGTIECTAEQITDNR
ncbi:MAG: exodeoxyribonuclease VII large subunit [Oscillospiraceae bacterium]|jgi:exodeoxyribonuclease VII large subunit|nr:exodeoxyribonuclease VII large subunit [Oscillospiraceae bacterium]